jgi:hypothetical protein
LGRRLPRLSRMRWPGEMDAHRRRRGEVTSVINL